MRAECMVRCQVVALIAGPRSCGFAYAWRSVKMGMPSEKAVICIHQQAQPHNALRRCMSQGFSYNMCLAMQAMVSFCIGATSKMCCRRGVSLHGSVAWRLGGLASFGSMCLACYNCAWKIYMCGCYVAGPPGACFCWVARVLRCSSFLAAAAPGQGRKLLATPRHVCLNVSSRLCANLRPRLV